jgi:chromosome segregation ATPase
MRVVSLQVFQLDISQQLQAYEVEYHVLQEEISRPPAPAAVSNPKQLRALEQSNQQLQQQKMELLEQLQSSRCQTRSLESQLERLQTEQGKLNSHIRTLELERAALLNSVFRLQHLLTDRGFELSELQIPYIQPNRTITNSPIHNPLVNPLISQYIEEGKLRFLDNSLSELDREVAALMDGRHSNAASSSAKKLSVMLPVKSTSGSNLPLPVQNGHERRPSSSNM